MSSWPHHHGQRVLDNDVQFRLGLSPATGNHQAQKSMPPSITNPEHSWTTLTSSGKREPATPQFFLFLSYPQNQCLLQVRMISRQPRRSSGTTGHNREAAQTPSNASAERELGHCRSRCPSVAVVLVTVSLTFMQCQSISEGILRGLVQA